jgi:hypothetical protein
MGPFRGEKGTTWEVVAATSNSSFSAASRFCCSLSTAICLEEMQIDQVYTSPVKVGSGGTVDTASWGLLPFILILLVILKVIR